MVGPFNLVAKQRLLLMLNTTAGIFNLRKALYTSQRGAVLWCAASFSILWEGRTDYYYRDRRRLFINSYKYCLMI